MSSLKEMFDKQRGHATAAISSRSTQLAPTISTRADAGLTISYGSLQQQQTVLRRTGTVPKSASMAAPTSAIPMVKPASTATRSRNNARCTPRNTLMQQHIVPANYAMDHIQMVQPNPNNIEILVETNNLQKSSNYQHANQYGGYRNMGYEYGFQYDSEIGTYFITLF